MLIMMTMNSTSEENKKYFHSQQATWHCIKSIRPWEALVGYKFNWRGSVLRFMHFNEIDIFKVMKLNKGRNVSEANFSPWVAIKAK